MKRLVTALTLLGLLGRVPPGHADDLTTLSGTTYHQVGVVRVEPDGVTWEHSTGMVKVDFTDLPAALRRTYHYDAARAAAFQAAQARAREQIAAQIQQTQRAVEVRRAERFQAPPAAAATAAGGPQVGGFVYRRPGDEAAGVRSLGEEIRTKKAADDFRTKDDGTVWDRRLWAVPVFLLGGNDFNGVAFDPHSDLNSHEFQRSLHHGAISDVKDTAGDAFFLPNYSTKSYNDDVDRAAAFARGHP